MKNSFEVNQTYLLRFIVVCPFILVILNWSFYEYDSFLSKNLYPSLPLNFTFRVLISTVIFTFPSLIAVFFLETSVVKKLCLLPIIFFGLGGLAQVFTLYMIMFLSGATF